MKDLLIKISALVTSILAIVGLSYTLVHADSNGKKYTAYDATNYRKVVDSSGDVDALWALCLQPNHRSPSYSTTKDNYTKIINATDEQILNYSDSKSADVKKLKRILYYKATHPDINYTVTQNEYYYQQGKTQGKTREYDATYKNDFQKEQKAALRSAAEDASKDALINDLMEVDIYASIKSNIQNLITVRVKEKPKEKDVVFSKVNLGGKEIAGAKIQINQGDRAIAEWTSEEGKSHTLKLAEGEYVFHEESAPEGYLAVTDITFTVEKDGKVTVESANGNTVKSEGNKLIVTDQAKPTPEKPGPKPQLPNTGEKASNVAVVAGLTLMAVTGGLYFVSRKNK